jgi:hypothetical protein
MNYKENVVIKDVTRRYAKDWMTTMERRYWVYKVAMDFMNII